MSTAVTREEFDAMAQYCLDSLKYRDSIIRTFRVACAYGSKLAEGKLDCKGFIDLMIASGICKTSSPHEVDDETDAMLKAVMSGTFEADNTGVSDLIEITMKTGVDGVKSPNSEQELQTSQPATARKKSPRRASFDARGSSLSRRVLLDKILDDVERNALYTPIWRDAHKHMDEMDNVCVGDGRDLRHMGNSVAMAKLMQVADYEVTDEDQLRSLFRSGRKHLEETDIGDIYWFVNPDGGKTTLEKFAILLLVVTERMFPEEFGMNHLSAFTLFMALHIVPYVRDMTPQSIEDIVKLRPVPRIPYVSKILSRYEIVLHNMFQRYASMMEGDQEAMNMDSFIDVVHGTGATRIRLSHEKLYSIGRLYESKSKNHYGHIMFTETQFVEAMCLCAFAMYDNPVDSERLPTLASRLQCLLDMFDDFYVVLFSRKIEEDLHEEAPPLPVVTNVQPCRGDALGGYDIVIHGKHFSTKSGGIIRFGDNVVVAHFVREEAMTVVAPEIPDLNAFDMMVFHREGTIMAKVIMKRTVDVRVSNDGVNFSKVTPCSAFTFEDHRPEFPLTDVQAKLLRVFSGYARLHDQHNTRHLPRPQWVKFLKDFNLYDPLVKDSRSTRHGTKEDNSDAIQFFTRCTVDIPLIGPCLRYVGFIRCLGLCLIGLGKTPHDGFREIVSTEQWIGRELLEDVDIIRKGEFRDKIQSIFNSFTLMQTLEHVPHTTTPRNPAEPLEEVDASAVGIGRILNLGELDSMFQTYLTTRHVEDQNEATESAMYKTWVHESSVENRKQEAINREDEKHRFTRAALVPNVDGAQPENGLILTKQHVDGLMRGVQRDRTNFLMRRADMENYLAGKMMHRMHQQIEQKEQQQKVMMEVIHSYEDRDRKQQLDVDIVAHGVLRSEKELWQATFTQQIENKKLQMEAAMAIQENERDIERDRVVDQYRAELQATEQALQEMHRVLDEQSKFLQKQSSVMEAMNLRMRILQAENSHLKVSQDDLMTMVQRDKYPERYSDWVQKNVAHKDKVEHMMKKLQQTVNTTEGMTDLMNFQPPTKAKITQWDKVDVSALMKEGPPPPPKPQKDTSQRADPTVPPPAVPQEAKPGHAVAQVEHPPPFGEKTAGTTQHQQQQQQVTTQNPPTHPTHTSQQGPTPTSTDLSSGGAGQQQGPNRVPPPQSAAPSADSKPLPVDADGFEKEIANQNAKVDELRGTLNHKLEELHSKVILLSEKVDKVKTGKRLPVRQSPQPGGKGKLVKLTKELDSKIANKNAKIDELLAEFQEKEQEYEERIMMLEESLEQERAYCVEGEILYCVRDGENMYDISKVLGAPLEDLLEYCGLKSIYLLPGTRYLRVSPSLLFQEPVEPENTGEQTHEDHDHEVDHNSAAIMEYTKVFKPGVSIFYHTILPTDSVESICAIYKVSRDDLLRANFIPLSTENADQSIQGIPSKQLRIPTFDSASTALNFDPFTRHAVGVNTSRPSSADAPPEITSANFKWYLKRLILYARNLKQQLIALKGDIVEDRSDILSLMQGANALLPRLLKAPRNLHTQMAVGASPHHTHQHKESPDSLTKFLGAVAAKKLAAQLSSTGKTHSSQNVSSPGAVSFAEFPHSLTDVSAVEQSPGVDLTIHTSMNQVEISPIEAIGKGFEGMHNSHRVRKSMAQKEFILFDSPRAEDGPSPLPFVVGTHAQLSVHQEQVEIAKVFSRKKLVDNESIARRFIVSEMMNEVDNIRALEYVQRPGEKTGLPFDEPPEATNISREDIRKIREEAIQYRKIMMARVKVAQEEHEMRQKENKKAKEARLQNIHKEAMQKKLRLLELKKPSNIMEKLKPSDEDDAELKNLQQVQGTEAKVKFLEPIPNAPEVRLNATMKGDLSKKPPAPALSTSLPPLLQHQVRSIMAIENTLKSLPNSNVKTEIVQQKYRTAMMKYLQRKPNEEMTIEEQRQFQELRQYLSSHSSHEQELMYCMESVAQSIPNSWAPMHREGPRNASQAPSVQPVRANSVSLHSKQPRYVPKVSTPT
eukprot:PhF_6_TR44169/c0_g1_i1/m.67657